jgi:hypothetical protein
MWSMISDRGRQVWKYVSDYGTGSGTGKVVNEEKESHSKPIAGSRNPVCMFTLIIAYQGMM